jgi:hypothetical protein
MFIYRVNGRQSAPVNFNNSKIIADFQGNFNSLPASASARSHARRTGHSLSGPGLCFPLLRFLLAIEALFLYSTLKTGTMVYTLGRRYEA